MPQFWAPIDPPPRIAGSVVTPVAGCYPNEVKFNPFMLMVPF